MGGSGRSVVGGMIPVYRTHEVQNLTPPRVVMQVGPRSYRIPPTHGLPKVVGGLNPTFSLRPTETETETEIETEAEESQEVDVSSMVTQLEANLWDQRAEEVTRRDEGLFY